MCARLALAKPNKLAGTAIGEVSPEYNVELPISCCDSLGSRGVESHALSHCPAQVVNSGSEAGLVQLLMIVFSGSLPSGTEWEETDAFSRSASVPDTDLTAELLE